MSTFSENDWERVDKLVKEGFSYGEAIEMVADAKDQDGDNGENTEEEEI